MKYIRHYFHSHQKQSIVPFLSRALTSVPHMAGLPEDLDSANVIEQRWKEDGLDVYKPKYKVLLSYPDRNNPNRLELISCIFTSIPLYNHLLVLRWR